MAMPRLVILLPSRPGGMRRTLPSIGLDSTDGFESTDSCSAPSPLCCETDGPSAIACTPAPTLKTSGARADFRRFAIMKKGNLNHAPRSDEAGPGSPGLVPLFRAGECFQEIMGVEKIHVRIRVEILCVAAILLDERSARRSAGTGEASG